MATRGRQAAATAVTGPEVDCYFCYYPNPSIVLRPSAAGMLLLLGSSYTATTASTTSIVIAVSGATKPSTAIIKCAINRSLAIGCCSANWPLDGSLQIVLSSLFTSAELVKCADAGLLQ